MITANEAKKISKEVKEKNIDKYYNTNIKFFNEIEQKIYNAANAGQTSCSIYINPIEVRENKKYLEAILCHRLKYKVVYEPPLKIYWD